MATKQLTTQSPFPLRLLAYSNERFPYWQVLSQFPMFVAAFLVGQAAVGRDPHFAWAILFGFIGFVAYTLMVRAIDDHKDWEHDSKHYPDRVLQSGLITLKHLKIVGIICFLLSILASLIVDRGIGRVTMWWFIIIVTNNLVQLAQIKNPKVGTWIESRRVLLALTVVPFWGLGSVWIAQMGADGRWLTADIWWLVAPWCVGALLLEIARKSQDPDDTRETVVDYTKKSSSWTRSLGLVGTVSTLVALAFLVTLLEYVLLNSLGYDVWWATLALVITMLLPLGAAGWFAVKPDRYRAKTVAEQSAGVWLIGQIILVIALLVVN
ncbi:UbiA family prenyltransferase [Antrihabitans cavernicola]|uniref:Prenyltransferase n=1 Tax=Antrihabitans cavernicola TaxID=2495913 RepID=A0A5A7SGV3_9NOCA|nr:UbiA family prenyltransferase [Spelaeibacter cavernicola]KAA0024854.1 hypothetical protein FOY51_02695 [Spelaeibacter cavernicola]